MRQKNLTLLALLVISLSLAAATIPECDLLDGFRSPPPDPVPKDLVLSELEWAGDWVIDPISGGLLVAKVEGANGTISRLMAPWCDSAPEPLPPGQVQVARFSLSGDGKRILVWRETDPSHAELSELVVWDRETRKEAHVERRTTKDGTLDHDGRLASISDYFSGTNVVALADSKTLATTPFGPGGIDGNMAWHPKSDALLIGSYGLISLLAGPNWREKRLATAPRDQAQWEADARDGKDESGFHPHENVNSLLFSEDGELLFCAVDRGLRVFRWADIVTASDSLPKPILGLENELVKDSWWIILRQTYSVAYDAKRQWILWTGLEGKLLVWDMLAEKGGTLLNLPDGWFIVRMALTAAGDALVVELSYPKLRNCVQRKIVILDYKRLAARSTIEL